MGEHPHDLDEHDQTEHHHEGEAERIHLRISAEPRHVELLGVELKGEENDDEGGV